MTRAQRVVILIGLLAIASLLLFPRWYAPYAPRLGRGWGVGHGFIFGQPPTFTISLYEPRSGPLDELPSVRPRGQPTRTSAVPCRVDIRRLLAECLMVIVLTGTIVFWLQGRKKPQASDNDT